MMNKRYPFFCSNFPVPLFIKSTHPGWKICCLLALVWLPGCADDDRITGRLLDYRERIERVLEIDFPELQPLPELVRYPTPKNLQRTPAEFTINWLDFFAIMDCDLNRLVGQRNSSLGKVMTASQRWSYEQEFLVVAGQCLTQLQAEDDPPEVATELEAILAQKYRDIDTIAWNATWAGPEFQTLMSFHDGVLKPDFRADQWAELTTALGALAAWSQNAEVLQSAKAHESLNFQLVTYPFFGRLVLSVLEADRLLSNINDGLRLRLQARPVCFNQTPNPRAQILRNVLVNIFVATIQPLLAELNKAQEQWRPLLATSYQALDGNESSRLKDFYDLYIGSGERSIWLHYKKTLTEHATLWTELLAQCGLRPGGRTSG